MNTTALAHLMEDVMFPTPEQIARDLSPAMVRALRAAARTFPGPTPLPRRTGYATMRALKRRGCIKRDWARVGEWAGWLFVLTDLGDRVWMSLPAEVRRG